MRPIDVVAAGAVSPLGTGRAAYAVGKCGERAATSVRRDELFERLGLRRPVAARAPLTTADAERPGALLVAAAEQLVRELDAALPDWRRRRLALCVGTSAGGISSLEGALAELQRPGGAEREAARRALYDGPLLALRSWFDAPVVQVLAACASSTVAVGLGCRWLDAGHAELVVAGGYDALTEFVASGFDALGATTATELKPFRIERDGMALGEGAALVALTRVGEAGAVLGRIVGFSATNDACHVTAPDPKGRGLASAARAALADAGARAGEIRLVSAHATATPRNDAAEALAIGEVLGAGAASTAVHAFKAAIGHCLGAAGILEALAAFAAIRAGTLPATAGTGSMDPVFPARLVDENEAGAASPCLKLSSGFGGVNAALVLAAAGEGSGSTRRLSPVGVLAAGELVGAGSIATLEPLSVVPRQRLERLSSAGELAATAAATALAALPTLRGGRAGVLVAASVGCLDENAAFERSLRVAGPRGVEPRRFSRTSPNLPAAECAIVFGFEGPSFAVGGGPAAPLEALLVAYDLVESGDAERVVVVASDEVGESAAQLLASAGVPVPATGARAVVLGRLASAVPRLDRSKLLALLEDSGPTGSPRPDLDRLTGAALLGAVLDVALA